MLPSIFTKTDFPNSMQLAVWIAMLSVVFEQWADFLYRDSVLLQWASALFVLWAVLYLLFDLRRAGIVVFVIGMLLSILPNWYSAANHSWLAIWTLTPLILFSTWWQEQAYSLYLRCTIGIVMLVSGLQKIVAGTYVDGSYVAWMSSGKPLTSQVFEVVCSSDVPEVCAWHIVAGIVVVLWQLAVGVLLLLGLRGKLFLAIEFGFLLVVGLFADEMNFQVLMISLLLIAFRIGMPRWVAVGCVALLIIDQISISYLVSLLLFTL
jgi:hypothetical protein